MPQYDENGNLIEEASKETVKVVEAEKVLEKVNNKAENNENANNENAQNSQNRIVRKPPMNIKKPQDPAKDADNDNSNDENK
jgi:hypothetical protein